MCPPPTQTSHSQKVLKGLLGATVLLTFDSDGNYHYRQELNKLVYVLKKITPLIPCASNSIVF